jgi:hypothetical protein
MFLSRLAGNTYEPNLFFVICLDVLYPSILGLWLGWLQRSWPRALCGFVLGVVVGLLGEPLNLALRSRHVAWHGESVLERMCFTLWLTSVLFALFLTFERDAWLGSWWRRLWSRLIGGFLTGLAVVILAAILDMISTGLIERASRFYVLWIAGPLVMGLVIGMFAMLLLWAVGLNWSDAWDPVRVPRALDDAVRERFGAGQEALPTHLRE